MGFHLDGARLFNAIIANNENPKTYGNLFDTISICLSKGLGAPIGSLLLGSKNNILKATRIRKAMGGGMRQAGFIAAAGLYALKNNVTRLSIDNERAKIIANILQQKKFVESVYPTETNIVIFKVNQNQLNIEKLLHELNNNNIKAVSMGNNLIRFVLHLNISDSEFDFIVNKLNELN